MAGNTLINIDQIVMVKSKLTEWGLLDPLFASSGDPRARTSHSTNWNAGCISGAEEFLKLFGAAEVDGVISEEEAKLILSKGNPHSFKPDNEKERKIVEIYKKNNWYIARGLDVYNVLWIRNINRDWTAKKGQLDKWDDMVLLWQAQHNGDIKIVEEFWQVTTEPGKHYTYNPCNMDGAARIAFGQFKSWSRGLHGSGRTAHQGFRQEAPIRVFRDKNQDASMSGDRTSDGVFYCNWHTTVGSPEDIGRWSAGCSVFRFKPEFNRFMQILEGDRRYEINKGYTFIGAYASGEEIANI